MTISEILQTAPGSMIDGLLFQVKRVVVSKQAPDGKWKFQVVEATDQTGASIEVKAWDKPDFAPGQTYSASVSDKGAGIDLVANEHNGKVTPQIVLKGSARVDHIQTPGAPVQQPVSTNQQPAPAAAAAPAQQPLPWDQGQGGQQTAEQVVLKCADLMIVCQRAARKYVAPKVLEQTGHTLENCEVQAVVSSLYIQAVREGALNK